MPNDKDREKLPPTSAGDDLLGHGEAMSALCSLSGGGESSTEQQPPTGTKTEPANDSSGKATRRKSSDSTGSGKGCCVKQLQLPMFLSSKFLLVAYQ